MWVSRHDPFSSPKVNRVRFATSVAQKTAMVERIRSRYACICIVGCCGSNCSVLGAGLGGSSRTER